MSLYSWHLVVCVYVFVFEHEITPFRLKCEHMYHTSMHIRYIQYKLTVCHVNPYGNRNMSAFGDDETRF